MCPAFNTIGFCFSQAHIHYHDPLDALIWQIQAHLKDTSPTWTQHERTHWGMTHLVTNFQEMCQHFLDHFARQNTSEEVTVDVERGGRSSVLVVECSSMEPIGHREEWQKGES